MTTGRSAVMRIRRLTAGHILLAIVLLALGLRLYHVTYPYLDHNSWRQTDTAAIARNYSRGGFNILRPELDMFGPGRTVVELELQITPFLTAFLYRIWGIRDWVGRVVPILFSLGSIVYFYHLVSLHFGQRPALLSAFVFAILPLYVYFTRVPMPESAAMLFAIGAVYHFSVYLQKETNLQYALAVGFAALAFLAKLTNLYLLMPLAALAVMRYRRLCWSNARLWLFVLITLCSTAAYYGYMHVTADIKLIPYQIGTDKWANLTILTSPILYQTLAYRLRTIVYTDLGFVLLVVGLLLPTHNQVFRVWILSALAYTFALATGSFVHTYYQMPLIPAGAFFIGSALDRISAPGRWRPLAGVLCATLLALAIMNLLPMYGIYGMSAYEAAQALKQIDGSGSPVLSVPEQRGTAPEILYYADRKGWVLYPEQLTVQAVDRFRALGARYVVVADYHLIPVSTRRYFDRYQQWQGERTLVVRLAR